MKNIFTFLLAMLVTINNYAQADINAPVDSLTTHDCDCTQRECASFRPDGHAPIGVMGDHVHPEKGSFMISYRYMQMGMSGNLNGSNDITEKEVLSNYMMSPRDMTMDMHMPGVMYSPLDRLTIMGMVNFYNRTMTMQPKTVSHTMDHGMGNMNGMNGTMTHEVVPEEQTMKSAGIGDVQLTALYNLYNNYNHEINAIAGTSIPTGSITERGNMGTMPYTMQNGSGTWDIIVGTTYLGRIKNFSWGAQVKGLLRTGANTSNYRLGNQYFGTAWFAAKVSDWVSFSFRVDDTEYGSITGMDKNINPMMSPLGNAQNSGKNTASSYLGFNVYFPKGTLEHLRLAGEFGLPMMQNTNHIQMKNAYQLNLGIQYAIY